MMALHCLFNATSNIKKNKSIFCFDFSEEAKIHNTEILRRYNFDITAAIRDQPNSMVLFGSEFRDPSNLEPLLHQHPNWPALKEILLNGASFPLQSIPNKARKLDLEFHAARGNHKSAVINRAALDEIIENDISKGYALPLLKEVLFEIPNASLAPLGCIKKDTINERGERSTKFRMTHDQSFLGPYLHSVNERVIRECLPNCMYSFALL